MDGIQDEIEGFLVRKRETASDARQMAAFRLALGIDLSVAISGDASERHRIVVRLQRIIERERQKGSRRHWSYDLNRHIALKQALNRIRSVGGPGNA